MFKIRDYLMQEYKCNYVRDELEADDLVVIYKNMLQAEYNPVIISPDKDILNLEGRHYNPKLNKWVITSKETANRYFWESMLVGDSADNIKGCKGIGPANANKILELSTDYRSTVLNKYCEIYSEHIGINEFYKNYNCLRMEEYYPHIQIPEFVELGKELSEPKEEPSDTTGA